MNPGGRTVEGSSVARARWRLSTTTRASDAVEYAGGSGVGEEGTGVEGGETRVRWWWMERERGRVWDGWMETSKRWLNRDYCEETPLEGWVGDGLGGRVVWYAIREEQPEGAALGRALCSDGGLAWHPLSLFQVSLISLRSVPDSPSPLSPILGHIAEQSSGVAPLPDCASRLPPTQRAPLWSVLAFQLPRR